LAAIMAPAGPEPLDGRSRCRDVAFQDPGGHRWGLLDRDDVVLQPLPALLPADPPWSIRSTRAASASKQLLRTNAEWRSATRRGRAASRPPRRTQPPDSLISSMAPLSRHQGRTLPGIQEPWRPLGGPAARRRLDVFPESHRRRPGQERLRDPIGRYLHPSVRRSSHSIHLSTSRRNSLSFTAARRAWPMEDFIQPDAHCALHSRSNRHMQPQLLHATSASSKATDTLRSRPVTHEPLNSSPHRNRRCLTRSPFTYRGLSWDASSSAGREPSGRVGGGAAGPSKPAERLSSGARPLPRCPAAPLTYPPRWRPTGMLSGAPR